MKLLRTASVLVLSAFALTGCDEGATSVEIADLVGTWNATQFEYTDQEYTSFSIDAISDAGGSVSLTVQESGGFVGTINIPNLTPGELPIGGTLSINGESLVIDFDTNTESYGLFSDFTASFTLDGDVLTFVNDDTSFDFPDTIEEQNGLPVREAVPATLSTRFIR